MKSKFTLALAASIVAFALVASPHRAYAGIEILIPFPDVSAYASSSVPQPAPEPSL